MVWMQGQRLQGGKYVIKSVLGQGGFGITYKALYIPSNELVVIKTPNEYLQFDPNYDKYIARFIQEGQILARLSEFPHPHIIGVRDLFQEGKTHCLVMDFIEGENLFQFVKRTGAIPEEKAVNFIRQIGEALVVVHQAGLVHRDAHPGNIMLRQNGKAVLIDFGIAKGLIPSTKTSTSKAGNEAFAPYEQMVRGSREPNVDVYCLAATLYYAVTAQYPTPALARRLDNQPLIAPKQIILGISNRVNQAILKGMALEAKNRPQSMQAWLKLLKVPQIETPPPHTRKTRIILWGCLTTMLVGYSLIGISLAEVVALAGALFGALVFAGLLALSGALHKALVKARANLETSLFASYLLDSEPKDLLKRYSLIMWALAVATIWHLAGTLFEALVFAGLFALFGASHKALVKARANLDLFASYLLDSEPNDLLMRIFILICAAMAGTIIWPIAGAVAGIGALAATIGEVEAMDKMLDSFNKFYIFLILLGTSWLGLGLGWLLSLISR